jgi:hypothetical protein
MACKRFVGSIPIASTKKTSSGGEQGLRGVQGECSVVHSRPSGWPSPPVAVPLPPLVPHRPGPGRLRAAPATPPTKR